ncbi:GTPase Era [Candidatus Neoehrlichia procyonis]|uniref:GTPase Era n=1 Tax=Candidatus Neoehrlichia procyonis str. RAC413 TaxID=1359163 RepID=A0A0F3NMR6_9RICK|nr:GTPase Era [Candidatus Neoehrlichia lotoris]KJV69002.1 GTP-binding protein Era [Candidatus Neoehrlichia lotoris str. RAC413]
MYSDEGLSNKNKKCSMITVVGTTNAGKSTLINLLIGQKVSIVTPKVQTTRVKMNAVYTNGNVQLIFTDTPGVFAAKTKLEKFLVKHAWMSIKGVDLAMLVIDPKKYLDIHVVKIINRIKALQIKVILVINKLDLISKKELDIILEHITHLYNFENIFAISALKNFGIDALIRYLSEVSPYGPWLYPDGQITDASMRFFTAEITREKLFMILCQELPYNLSVVTEQIEEKERSLIVKQVIYVTKESHKTIVVGKNANVIKNVSLQSKSELEEYFQMKIHLFLFVKVRKFWQDHLEECVGQ